MAGGLTLNPITPAQNSIDFASPFAP